MAEYDLTSLVSKYLDRHLVFPLLEFLSVKGLYDEGDMLRGKLELLHNTNMVDFAIDIHKQLHGETNVPDSLHEKRSEVMGKLTSLSGKTKAIVSIFSNPDVCDKIKESRDNESLLSYLREKHGFSTSNIDAIYEYAKFQYECGFYAVASEYLEIVRILLPANHKNVLNTQWGKLASTILMQDWDGALEEVNKLRETIDSSVFSSALESLMQRAWLIHWSLFVYFNHPSGKDYIIDLFLNKQQYINAIQTLCPHILRYLTTAVITNKNKRRTVLKDLVKVIQQESYAYRDPITEFVECLYVNFDFEGAQTKLRECDTVLMNDFFLVECRNDFLDSARNLIFETFCRIHQCISIDMLAEKLNMTSEEAEHWIVDLIRNARLDAKIDSKLGHVVMGTVAVSPYQQVIEKTKALSIKSQLLAARTGVKFNEPTMSYIYE